MVALIACPLCGGEVDRVRAEDGGAIERTVYSPELARVTRQVGPATYHACTRCEWCEERSTR